VKGTTDKNLLINNDARKLQVINESASPNTSAPNTDRTEFVSRLYRAKRTLLLRVPKAVAEIEGLKPGEFVKAAIIEKVKED
jgi:hypothetical protein